MEGSELSVINRHPEICISAWPVEKGAKLVYYPMQMMTLIVITGAVEHSRRHREEFGEALDDRNQPDSLFRYRPLNKEREFENPLLGTSVETC